MLAQYFCPPALAITLPKHHVMAFLFFLDQVFGGFNADMYAGAYDVTFLLTKNELTVNNDVTDMTVFT